MRNGTTETSARPCLEPEAVAGAGYSERPEAAARSMPAARQGTCGPQESCVYAGSVGSGLAPAAATPETARVLLFPAPPGATEEIYYLRLSKIIPKMGFSAKSRGRNCPRENRVGEQGPVDSSFAPLRSPATPIRPYSLAPQRLGPGSGSSWLKA